LRFFVGLFVLILLSSCASVGKGVFIKRKYNKGYHIDLASHKQTEPRKRCWLNDKSSSSEEQEVVVLEKEKIDPEVQSISTSTETVEQSIPHNYSFQQGGFAPQKLPVKERVVENVVKLRTQKNLYNDFKFGLMLVLFVILTIVYTISILFNYPAFPFVLAVVVAMLGALLTLLTGQVFL